MSAQKREINLVPKQEWEQKPLGRIVKWALTVGRYLVIITELVVIVLFISRFKLDRDLSNLNEDIKIKKAQIESMAKFEKEFRQTQKKIKTVKEILEGRSKLEEAVSKLTSLIPQNITLYNLEVKTDQVDLAGTSLNENELALFLYNLKSSPHFKKIQLGDITKKENKTLYFNLKANLALTTNENK